MLLLLAAGALVLAQSSADFNLEWHVIGNSGGASGSASYEVRGTIGQSLVSPVVSNSAGYAMSSGYWFSGGGQNVYLPLIVK